MRIRAKRKIGAKEAAPGARIPQEELFVLHLENGRLSLQVLHWDKSAPFFHPESGCP